MEFNPIRMAALGIHLFPLNEHMPFEIALYTLDFTAFKELGYSLTGATYVKTIMGPLPLESARAQMAQYHGICYSDDDHNHELMLVWNECFSEAETELVDRVTGDLEGYFKALAGHGLANIGEEIPYGTAFMTSDALSTEETEWLEAVLSDVFNDFKPDV